MGKIINEYKMLSNPTREETIWESLACMGG
jgi:hypothetical protein